MPKNEQKNTYWLLGENVGRTSVATWKAKVNWHTVLAYDATQALIAGLKDNPTRQGIQATLSAS